VGEDMHGLTLYEKQMKRRRFLFAEVLGPAYVPEVNEHMEVLMTVQAHVVAAAARWSLFFETMQ